MSQKTTLCLIGFVLVILFAGTVSFAEELKLETYYPSPSGHYNILRAKRTAFGQDSQGDLRSIDQNFSLLSSGNVRLDNGYIVRTGSSCLGTNAATHVNLGINSQTGDSTGDRTGITVSGGVNHTAKEYMSTISGGRKNTASGPLSTVSGGSENTAVNDWCTVSGGSSNEASHEASTVCGGISGRSDP